MDPKRYQELLEGLIAQGLFQILEKDISLKCKRDDLPAVKVCDLFDFSTMLISLQILMLLNQKAIPNAVASFKSQSGMDVKITINDAEWLGGDVSGGVVMSAHGGRIKVENTLESRLNLISKQVCDRVNTALQIFCNMESPFYRSCPRHGYDSLVRTETGNSWTKTDIYFSAC